MLQLRSDSGQVFQSRFAATAATVAKVPFVQNARVFIPLNTADAGVVDEHVYQSEVSDAPCVASEAWDVGDPVYFVVATKVFTTTAATNTLCGFALAAKAADASTVAPLFKFDSFAAIA